MDKNERIILNYIVQIRKPFSLQQVVDDTGLPKTNCFRVFKKLLEEERIYRTRDGQKPKLYRYRYAEEEKTAKEKGLYIFDETFISELKAMGEFTIKEVAERLNCSYLQAKRHINNLRNAGKVSFLRRENRKWIYVYGKEEGTPVDSEENTLKAIQKLEENNKTITKRAIAEETKLSIPTVKVVLAKLMNDGLIAIDRIEKTANIYRRIS